MSRNLALIFVLWISIEFTVGVQAREDEVVIIEPQNDASVPERPYISGTVADSNAEVWIVVHPMEVSDYWIQPKPTVRADGSWKASVYIGRPGSSDAGKRFEIIAIANPRLKLKEGDVLGSWPEANWKSEVIEVVRK